MRGLHTATSAPAAGASASCETTAADHSPLFATTSSSSATVLGSIDEIKSDKTDHIAMHKGNVLHKID